DATQTVTSGQVSGTALEDVLKRPPTPEETARLAALFRNLETKRLPIGFSCLGADPLRPTADVFQRCRAQLMTEIAGQWGLKITGWLVTALAISLGAPFWFQLVNRFVDIRGAGKKPEAKSESALTSDR